MVVFEINNTMIQTLSFCYNDLYNYWPIFVSIQPWVCVLCTTEACSGFKYARCANMHVLCRSCDLLRDLLLVRGTYSAAFMRFYVVFMQAASTYSPLLLWLAGLTSTFRVWFTRSLSALWLVWSVSAGQRHFYGTIMHPYKFGGLP